MHPAEPDFAPDPQNIRTDLALQAQALRERWPIAPDVRAKILESAVELCTARKPNGSLKSRPRTVVSALRVIAVFDRLSLEQLKIEVADPFRERPEEAPPLPPDVAAKIIELLLESQGAFDPPQHLSGDPVAPWA